MGVQTVIILVLAVNLALAHPLAYFGWQKAWKLMKRDAHWEQAFKLQVERAVAAEALQQDYLTQINRLQAQLAQIPLTPAPKKAENGPVQAKSAAQIRSMTERAWGKTPEGDEANGSV